VRAPGWRYYDFERRKPNGEIYAADLFEEAVRLHGYDAIPSTLPRLLGRDAPQTTAQSARRRIRDHLVGCGFAEAINFAFHSSEQAARFPAIGALPLSAGPLADGQMTGSEPPAVADVELANPLSELYAVLRRSLLPGLVESAGFNQRRNATAVALFELGNTFLLAEDGPDGGAAEGALPRQVEAVSLIQGGAGTHGDAWEPRAEMDFFHLKGVVESLVAALLPGAILTARPARMAGFLPGAAAELWLRTGEHPVDGGPLGYLGQVDDDGPFPLFAAELLLAPLTGGGRPSTIAAPSRFPSVEVDLTLTHALAVPWSELAAAIGELRPENLREHGLKVRYRGKGVPAGAVNTTISFSYNAEDRSLTHEEVNERHQALAAELKRRFGFGRVRGLKT
jgi:phenylalanyl-tRNA synthetase beta chain